MLVPLEKPNFDVRFADEKIDIGQWQAEHDEHKRINDISVNAYLQAQEDLKRALKRYREYGKGVSTILSDLVKDKARIKPNHYTERYNYLNLRVKGAEKAVDMIENILRGMWDFNK